MQRQNFHFDLPAELIAQRPVAERSASRMLVLDGASGAFRDRQFRDFPDLLRAGDLLVFNDTRVIPARLFGQKASGGKVEILLERQLSATTALVHVRASKGLKIGAMVNLPGGHRATMLQRQGELFELKFDMGVGELFETHGRIPLPPYIDREPDSDDRERYQTLYARVSGAIAAPTAGLHFDRQIFRELEQRQVSLAYVTLHVGAGTFAPVRVDEIDAHEMHEEHLEVPQATCSAIAAARELGGRVIAVGTTVVRSLETAAAAPGGLAPYRGSTRMFIKPGQRFRAVDALLTNFHLPESTLLMLCSAFVGREALMAAYAHAVQARYRFFSYGDAMFMTPSSTALGPRPAGVPGS